MKACPNCVVRSLVFLTVVGVSASTGHSQARLRVARQTIRADIQGLVATTTVENVYANGNARNAEVTYDFELPDSASMHGLAMWVNDVRCPAVVYPRATARRIYRQIVETRRDPAILEYLGRGRWHLRVFPIPAGGTQKVQIVFSHVMPTRRGRIVYEYPRVTRSTEVTEVDFSARIRCPGGVVDVIAQTHRLGAHRGLRGDVTVGFRGPGGDGRGPISFAFVPRAKPGAVVTSLGQDGRAGFLAEAPWPKLLDDTRPGRNVVLVLDASASMEDPKLRWLQTAVGRVLKALRAADRFAVVVARDDVDLWRGGELTRADAKTVAAAWKYVQDLRQSGGTDLAAGLRAAEACNTDKTRPLWVVVLTDGDDMIGAKGLARFDELRRRNRPRLLPAENIRLNLFFLSAGEDAGELSFALGGKRWFVDNDRGLKGAMNDFLADLAAPVVEDLRVSITSAKEVGLADVAHSVPTRGRAMSFAGRYAKGGEVAVTVSARVDARPRRASARVQLPDPPASPSEAWASDAFEKILAHRQCDWLWQRLQEPKAGLETLERLVALSRAERIVTRATAFLILETERDYVTRGLEPPVVDLPAGRRLGQTGAAGRRAVGPQIARRVAALKRQAKALRDAGRYTQAAEVLASVQDVDPRDFGASLSAAILREFVVIREAAHLDRLDRPVSARAYMGPWHELFQPVGVVSLVPVSADGKPIRRPRAAPLPPELANRGATKLLRRGIAKLEFTDIELKDVVQFLRDVTGTNIQVKWAALGLAGIDKSTAVNVHIKGVTLAKALHVVLDDVGGGSTQLSYVVEDGVVTISTREDLSSRTITLVYDVRDLAPLVQRARGLLPMHRRGFSRRRWRDTAFFDDATDSGGGRESVRMGEVSVPSDENAGLAVAQGADSGVDRGTAGDAGRWGDAIDTFERGELRTRQQPVADIVDLARNTIDPTSWRTAGGEIGAIRMLGAVLVVTQTMENHRELAALIKTLRKTGPNVPEPVDPPDLADEPEAMFTAHAQLKAWVLHLLGRARRGKLSKFSSVAVRKVGKRVFARIGGIWFDTALTAKSQVTLIRRDSPAARAFQSARPETKPALALGRSVILVIDETRAVSLDQIGITRSDSADLKKLLPAGGK